MKHILFIWLSFCILLPDAGNAQSSDSKQFVVVLDAGHGGKDPGALGKRSQEKDIVLDIVLRTGKYLNENYSDVKVIYTRSTDIFVELDRRTKIANDAKADLFVSVHCNANESKTPHGTEVYVMGTEKTEANLAVAMKENSAALLEDNSGDRYDGIDPNSAEAYIAFSLFQNIHIENSLSMAQFLMKAMNKNLGLLDRGTKQAPFFVLYRTAMPSVLIEAGFISNLSDEAILMSDAGKEKIAYSIYSAINAYRNEVEKTTSSPGAMHAISQETPVQQDNKTGIVFKIQFASFQEIIPISDSRFSALRSVSYIKSGSYYKYYCGESANYSEVLAYLTEVRKKGYSDAFLVAFNNGSQISIQDARRISGQ